jgi:hypothetical protein
MVCIAPTLGNRAREKSPVASGYLVWESGKCGEPVSKYATHSYVYGKHFLTGKTVNLLNIVCL